MSASRFNAFLKGDQASLSCTVHTDGWAIGCQRSSRTMPPEFQNETISRASFRRTQCEFQSDRRQRIKALAFVRWSFPIDSPSPSREAAGDNIIPARRSLLHARSPKLGEILKFLERFRVISREKFRHFLKLRGNV